MSVPGGGDGLNQSLEQANRVSDFLEFAELICLDALNRNESCGAHFREEHQYTREDAERDPALKGMEGEAKPNHKDFAYVAAWEYKGVGKPPELHKEPLVFEYVKPSVRSYK